MKINEIDWKKYGFIVICLIIATGLIIYTNKEIIKDYTVSSDEYSYLLQASLFSQGKLSTTSPVNPELYWCTHIVNDGKFYSKYPFGWPLFLTIGVLLRMPMIVNLLFALGTILLVYLLGRKIFSESVAKLAVIIMIFNSYFLSFSSSYLSHSCSLFFITLFLYIYFSSLKKESKWTYLLLGVIFGVIFNIRPADTLALGLFFMISYLFLTRREFEKFDYKKLFSHIGLFLIGFAVLFSFFLLYNYLQTGNPILMPFVKYDPSDKLNFFRAPSQSYHMAMENLMLLNRTFPFLLFFALASVFICKKKDLKFITAFILLFLMFLLIYSFYWNSGATTTYPRYLYASLSSLCLLAGYFFNRVNKQNPLIFKIIFLLFMILIFFNSNFIFNEIRTNEKVLIRDNCFSKLKEMNLSNAIVFGDQTLAGYGTGKLMKGIYYPEYIKMFERNVILAHINYSPEEVQKLKNNPNYTNRTFYLYSWKGVEHSELSMGSEEIKEKCHLEEVK